MARRKYRGPRGPIAFTSRPLRPTLRLPRPGSRRLQVLEALFSREAMDRHGTGTRDLTVMMTLRGWPAGTLAKRLRIALSGLRDMDLAEASGPSQDRRWRPTRRARSLRRQELMKASKPPRFSRTPADV